jgi:hypothetical protein
MSSESEDNQADAWAIAVEETRIAISEAMRRVEALGPDPTLVRVRILLAVARAILIEEYIGRSKGLAKP